VIKSSTRSNILIDRKVECRTMLYTIHFIVIKLWSNYSGVLIFIWNWNQHISSHKTQGPQTDYANSNLAVK
jgi:hypothetical protein